MITQPLVSEIETNLHPQPQPTNKPPLTLWLRLARYQRKQLAQHWAQLIRQMRHSDGFREEQNDERR